MLGGGFWMLFHPVASAPLTWFAVSVLICTTGFSVVTINLQTLGGLWKTSSAERTRVTGAAGRRSGSWACWRAAIAPTLLKQWTGQTLAFHYLTLAYLPLLAGAFFLLMVWLKSAKLSQPASASSPESWGALLKDRWRTTFFSLVLLNTFASAIPAVLVLFFVRDRLGAEAFTGLFLLIYFLAGTASMPLWIRLAARFGKVRAWQLSLGLAVVTFIWAALLGRGDLAAYAVVCGLSGLALGADLALPPALLADHIDADKRQAEASRLFSLMALVSKASLAAATGLALPILGLLGYAHGERNDAATGLGSQPHLCRLALHVENRSPDRPIGGRKHTYIWFPHRPVMPSKSNRPAQSANPLGNLLTALLSSISRSNRVFSPQVTRSRWGSMP